MKKYTYFLILVAQLWSVGLCAAAHRLEVSAAAEMRCADEVELKYVEENESVEFTLQKGAKIIGNVRSWLYPFCCDGIKTGTITLLSVDPEYRRKGYGSKLMQAALDDLRERGCGRIYLTAIPLDAGDEGYAETQMRLVRWYERFGFEVQEASRMVLDCVRKTA